MTVLPRFCFSDLESLGDTLFQSLPISPKRLSSNPIHSFYSSWESTVISGKSYSVSGVSKFHLQLISVLILHLIIPGEGTQNELMNDSLKLLPFFLAPLSFSQAFACSALDSFKLCQGTNSKGRILIEM